MLISTPESIIFSNKNGELYTFNENSGEAKMIKNDFYKNIESYNCNSTHVYFFEKNSKMIYRTLINVTILKEVEEQKNKTFSSFSNNSIMNNMHSHSQNSRKNSMVEDLNKLEGDIKKQDLFFKKSFLETELFLNLEVEPINGNLITPIKLIVDDKKLVVIDKNGEINVINLQEQEKKQAHKNYQCLFMLRNCHLSNTALIGDGDLLLLDPIRLSLNKLNIIAGTEVIVLHSTKFLYTIKNIFSANSRIYFIDVSGNLYYFNEVDKKLTQIGNNGICKYIIDFAIFKNYILTIENNTLYRTNLNDGNYIEIKNDFCKNYEYFFADNQNIIFITKDDEIQILNVNINTPSNKDSNSGSLSGRGDNDGSKDYLKLKNSFKYDKISKMASVTYFRNNIIFYNKEKKKSIESINLEDRSHKKMVENFPEVNMFINNNDFLACILKDGVIYKLYC